MAKKAVGQYGCSIRVACAAFAISVVCYRYHAKLSSENAVIADWLVRLTNNQRNWGIRHVLPVSAQRQGVRLEP